MQISIQRFSIIEEKTSFFVVNYIILSIFVCSFHARCIIEVPLITCFKILLDCANSSLSCYLDVKDCIRNPV